MDTAGVGRHRGGSERWRVAHPPPGGAAPTHHVWILGVRRATPVSGTWDERISQIAGRQRARVARHQLLAAAIAANAIDRRLRGGALTRVHRGVYAIGPQVSTPLADETAALLALRSGSVLSHHSAAALWGLRPSPAIVHVLVPGSSAGPRLERVNVHRTRRLETRDMRIRYGLPVTSAARALLDIARTLSMRELERAYDQALVSGVATRRDVERELARGPAPPALRAMLERQIGPTLTRSEAEERFLALVRAARLPAPRVNARAHGYELDFYWPAARMVVEIDGYAFHSTHRAFEADHRKDADLRAAGLTVLRFTWRQLIEDATAVIVEVAQALVRA